MNVRVGLLEELRAHATSDAHEEQKRRRMIAFIEAQPHAFERACRIGHVTASSWIVDRARARTLLTHHRKLGKWLQLGGHVDGDPDIRAAALREAREESGLRSLRFLTDAIYDVDIHHIPIRGDEPAHDHFDVRFALEADLHEPLVVSPESHELAWVPLAELGQYDVDESVLRLARKTASLAKDAEDSGSTTYGAGTTRV